MYKTIRHGENSLQYTILPQHDDYKGADGKPRSAKTGRKKKSLVACLGLFFVCSIIAGAILVPLMVSVEYMSSPSTWFYKSHESSAATINPLKAKKVIYEELKKSIDYHPLEVKKDKLYDKLRLSIDDTLEFSPEYKQQVYPTKQSTTVTYLPRSTELDLSTIKIATNSSSTSSTTTTTTVATTTTAATTTPTTTIIATEQHLQPTSVPALTTASTSKPTKRQTPSPSAVIENQTKPFTKPVIFIQPEFNTKPPLNTLDNVEKTESSKNWIKSHWPIVDPSTYFSWTAYESEDNILLPAIFCSALVAVVVFILLCFVVRKRNCFCSKKRHEFMAVEAENGDSTVLLTNDCPSEDE